MTRPATTDTMLIDDARVRVTRFDFAPEAQTGQHVHGHDYVIVAITGCPLLIEHPDGSTSTADVAAGDAYHRDMGVDHNVINRGTTPIAFVEVELKEAGFTAP